MKTYQIDRKNWAKKNIFEQMGNISSEVGRSFDAKRAGDNQRCENATIRALDLFDATVDSLISRKSIKSKEVLRARDQFLHAIYDKDSTDADAQSLEKYFLSFAIASRLNR